VISSLLKKIEEQTRMMLYHQKYQEEPLRKQLKVVKLVKDLIMSLKRWSDDTHTDIDIFSLN
jgi:hypothetical protein